MRIASVITVPALVAVIFAAVGVSSLRLHGDQATAATPGDPPGRYLPEYMPNGDLILPKGFEKWIFVGSPLTPNALNGGKANFPEFHNVYMEPASYEIYQRTGVFPEGTIFVKELQLTLGTPTHPDGSSEQPSGRGFFPGPLNGADVTVKDSKRYAATGGWGYFNFHHYEPKAKFAPVRPKNECSFCHQASAKKDEVWTQFYPRLDK